MVLNHDPNECYRFASYAEQAKAYAHAATANAAAAAANVQAVTCAGCVGKDDTRMCEPLRCDGLCQRQVYVKLALARLVVEVLHILSEMQASEDLIRDVLTEMRGTLDGGYADLLEAAARPEMRR